MDSKKSLGPAQKTVVGSFDSPFYCRIRNIDLSFGNKGESADFFGK